MCYFIELVNVIYYKEIINLFKKLKKYIYYIKNIRKINIYFKNIRDRVIIIR